MRKFTVRMSTLGILAALASFGMANTAANATCTTSTDADGNTVENCAVVGQDEFHVNEHFSNQESLTLNQRGVTWLTIQVYHMTPNQIAGQCKVLPVGTFIWNGFINPVTGEVKYQPWHVTSGPGENKFCLGHDGKWHKFNCNNPVKGPQFGTPPPPPKQRLKASTKTGNYATWRAHKKLTASKHIGGSIDVRSQDNTCHAHVALDNKVRITDWMSVTFRSRSLTQAKTDAVNAVKIKAGSSQSLHGKLSQKASIFINAKISAQCTTTPPAADKPSVTATTLNDLYQGEYSDNWCVNTKLPNGDPGKLTFDTVYGTIRNGIGGAILNSYEVQGVNRYCFTYYAPNDPGTTHNLTEKVTVDLVDTATNKTADTYHVPDFIIQPRTQNPGRNS